MVTKSYFLRYIAVAVTTLTLSYTGVTFNTMNRTHTNHAHAGG